MRFLLVLTAVVALSGVAQAKERTAVADRVLNAPIISLKDCRARATHSLRNCLPMQCSFRNEMAETLYEGLTGEHVDVLGYYAVQPLDGARCAYRDFAGAVEGSPERTEIQCRLSDVETEALALFLSKTQGARGRIEASREAVVVNGVSAPNLYQKMIDSGVCRSVPVP